jgi:hypothetical protein
MKGLQGFYLTINHQKFSGGFLKNQHIYTKPLNTLAMLGKLENNYFENNKS